MLLKSTDTTLSKARHPSLLPRWQNIPKYSQVTKHLRILYDIWPGLPPDASSLRWSTSSWCASVTSASSWTQTIRQHRTLSTVSRCNSIARWSDPDPVRTQQTLTIDQVNVPVHEETLQVNKDSSMRLLYQKSVQVYSKFLFRHIPKYSKCEIY